MEDSLVEGVSAEVGVALGYHLCLGLLEWLQHRRFWCLLRSLDGHRGGFALLSTNIPHLETKVPVS